MALRCTQVLALGRTQIGNEPHPPLKNLNASAQVPNGRFLPHYLGVPGPGGQGSNPIELEVIGMCRSLLSKPIVSQPEKPPFSKLGDYLLRHDLFRPHQPPPHDSHGKTFLVLTQMTVIQATVNNPEVRNSSVSRSKTTTHVQRTRVHQ